MVKRVSLKGQALPEAPVRSVQMTMFCGECGSENRDGQKFCVACGQPLAAAGGRAASDRLGREVGGAASVGPDHLGERPTLVGLPQGSLLARRYRIVRPLGQGGMGAVYLAQDQTLGIAVAVKTLSEQLRYDPGSVQRLKDETRLAMQLTHPHIVRVHTFDEDGLVAFLVMEYVDGQSLAHRLAKEERLPEDEVRRIGVALCEGLAYAHAKNVLHRDIKPLNVLLGTDGSIKLADFGIARVAHDSLSRLSGVQTAGTFVYMAPEAVLGHSTVSTDLYSVGVVLYELLTGAPPFHTGDLGTQILKIVPPPPAGAGAELSAVVMKLLAKAAAERFPSAEAVLGALNATAGRSEEEQRQREEAAARERTRKERDQAEGPPWREEDPLLSGNDLGGENRRPEKTRVQQEPEEKEPARLGPPAELRPRWKRFAPLALTAVAVAALVAVLLWQPWAGSRRPETTVPTALTPSAGVSVETGMASLPAGSFYMGSPASEEGRDRDEDRHQVTIARAFRLDMTEVTYQAYQAFVRANPVWQKGHVPSRLADEDYLRDWQGTDYPSGQGQFPVVWVSWHAAEAYCRWAGKRLPTEAEWEYAARAGTQTAYWWGDGFDGTRANNGAGAVEVGARARVNPWGLADMLGNVWEWTASQYAPYPYRGDDGREGPGEGERRVIRGGSWGRAPQFLRSALRGGGHPSVTNGSIGFRCAQ